MTITLAIRRRVLAVVLLVAQAATALAASDVAAAPDPLAGPVVSEVSLTGLTTREDDGQLLTWLRGSRADLETHVRLDDPDQHVTSVVATWHRPGGGVLRTHQLTRDTTYDGGSVWIYDSPGESLGAKRYGQWTVHVTARDADGGQVASSDTSLTVADLDTARRPRILSVTAKKVRKVRAPASDDWLDQWTTTDATVRIKDPDQMVFYALAADHARRGAAMRPTVRQLAMQRRGDVLVIRAHWTVRNLAGRHRLTLRAGDVVTSTWNQKSYPLSRVRGHASFTWRIVRP